MFVSYESHLPSKGTRNHMTSLPSTQTESYLPSKGMFSIYFFFQNSSISILLIHTIFVPKSSPYIH